VIGELGVNVSPVPVVANATETPPAPAGLSRATLKLVEGKLTTPVVGPVKVAVVSAATVTLAEAVWLVSRFPVAVIVVEPLATAITSPVLLTVATAGLLEDQVTP
jgi:hypothetical protein